tara:strand:- start:813 stop:965 length:153 start_codon:yes stop_codon:yes gene_type:complete
MNQESILLIVAPLTLFLVGVLIIPFLSKPRNKSRYETFKAIDDFEKKYIY